MPLRTRPLQACVVAAGIGVGCGRGEASRAESAPVAEGALASQTSFDLVTTETGALLGWISRAPSTVSLARFDVAGELVGSVTSKALGAAPAPRDVSLAPTQAGAWVAWIDGEPSRARAAMIEDSATSEPQVLDLGVAWHGGGSEARGNLALAERRGGALALARGASAPCADAPEEECFAFKFYELSAAGARSAGVPLSVPVPCSAQAAQLVAAEARSLPGEQAAAYEYAICTRVGESPVLTVFSIDPLRSYAAAQRVLPGCVPLGAGCFAERSSFVAECGSDRRMATLSDPDRPPQLTDLSVRGLVCEGEQPKVRLGREWLALAAPVDHLELLVGEDLAPRGARVVWTGRALMIATAGEDLQIARYACRGSRLERLESPALRT